MSEEARPAAPRRIPWLRLAAIALLALIAAVLLPLGCHGSRVAATFVPNHGVAFDFASPPCDPAPHPGAGEDDVVVRYLGVSSLLIEWRGARVMTAPFFSNVSPGRAAFGTAGWDEGAIRDGLAGVDLDGIGAVLTGHSHYDHLSDLPPLLMKMAPAAQLYANRSGANMLAAFPELDARVTVLNEHDGRWMRLHNAYGEALPVRVMPLASGHTNHYGFYHYARGSIDTPWTDWAQHDFSDMKEGLAFTLLIDLLDEDDRPVFRLFHQDASAPAPLGLPPEEVIAERPVDLAALCMPSHWHADGYPEQVVERLRARHRMAIHYEDFFRDREKPLRFVAMLSDNRADDFLEAMACGAGSGDEAGRSTGPDPCGCGPCGPACSMPLPGEWLRFATENR